MLAAALLVWTGGMRSRCVSRHQPPVRVIMLHVSACMRFDVLPTPEVDVGLEGCHAICLVVAAATGFRVCACAHCVHGAVSSAQAIFQVCRCSTGHGPSQFAMFGQWSQADWHALRRFAVELWNLLLRGVRSLANCHK